MSTPASARPTPMQEATRQQLDELDALIERMLQIPVATLPDNPLDESPPPQSTPADRDIEFSSAHRHPLSAEAGAREEMAPPKIAPLFSQESAPPNEEEIGALPVDSFGATDETKPQPIAAAELFALRMAEPAHSMAARDDAPPLAGWLAPVVLVNRAFDIGVAAFGPPGRWLRTPSGRTLLGGVGLAVLATALVWGVLDWIAGNW